VIVVFFLCLFFFFFLCFLFLCVRVCVHLCMYVRVYLAIPCVSANDNVKHTKSNFRYDNKINKWNKCEIYKNSCIWVHRMDVCQQHFSSRQKAKILTQILNKTWRRWQAMAPHPIPLPCALAFTPPSHRDATTPSPCGTPHFITQERIMLSNPTPSKPRSLPPRRWAMTRHWLSLHPCTAPPSCSLQPLLKLSLLSLRPSLLQFVSIISPSLNHGNLITKPVCLFVPFPLLSLLCW